MKRVSTATITEIFWSINNNFIIFSLNHFTCEHESSTFRWHKHYFVIQNSDEIISRQIRLPWEALPHAMTCGWCEHHSCSNRLGRSNMIHFYFCFHWHLWRTRSDERISIALARKLLMLLCCVVVWWRHLFVQQLRCVDPQIRQSIINTIS
jgi:hypothetical protein